MRELELRCRELEIYNRAEALRCEGFSQALGHKSGTGERPVVEPQRHDNRLRNAAAGAAGDRARVNACPSRGLLNSTQSSVAQPAAGPTAGRRSVSPIRAPCPLLRRHWLARTQEVVVEGAGGRTGAVSSPTQASSGLHPSSR